MYRPPPAIRAALDEGCAVVEHKKKPRQGAVGPGVQDVDELFVVLAGELEMLRGRSWAPAPPGTLGCFPRRKRYGIRARRGYDGPARIVSILFRASAGWNAGIPAGPVRLNAVWWRRLLELEAGSDYSPRGQRVLPLADLLSFLERLARALGAKAAKQPVRAAAEPRRPDTQAEWFEQWARAEDLIRERAGEGLDAAGLAQALHVSPTQLRRIFHAARGCSPKHALDAWRIAEARRLLRAGKLNATQVAARVGYRTLQRFSAAFKAATGQPPGKYAREP